MGETISIIQQQPIRPLSKQRDVSARKATPADGKDTSSVPFSDVLQEKIAEENKVTFSHHAQQRLRMRNIQLSSQQIERITSAIDRAAQKGARDSLLLVDNIATVVSVENRTVITVADGDSLTDNVFTNIDSAVIA